MPVSDAKKRANKKWNDANMARLYDRISLLVPKGRKATLEARAEAVGAKSLNEYISGLARADLGLSVEEWKGLQPQPVDVEASDMEPMEVVDALDRAEAVPVVVPVEAAAEAVDRAQVEAVQPVEEAAAADGLAEVEEAEAVDRGQGEAVPQVEAARVEPVEEAAALDRGHVEAVPQEEEAAEDVPEVQPVEDAAQPFELFSVCLPFGRGETLRREAAKDRRQVSELVRDAVECYLPDDLYLPREMSFVQHFQQARAAVEAARADDAARSNKEAGDFVTVYFENGSLEVIEELAERKRCSANRIINLALAKCFEMPFAVWTFEEKPQPKKREKLPWENGLY